MIDSLYATLSLHVYILLLAVKYFFIFACLNVLKNMGCTVTYFLPIPCTVPRTRASPVLITVSLLPSRVKFYIYIFDDRLNRSLAQTKINILNVTMSNTSIQKYIYKILKRRQKKKNTVQQKQLEKKNETDHASWYSWY